MIRNATKKDKEKIAEFYKHYGKLSIKRAECYTEHNHTTIAEENKIVGAIQWLIKEDPKNGTIELEELYVEPEHRGKGIATKLISQAVRKAEKELQAKGFKFARAYAFVSERNEGAKKAFAKNGFKKTADAGNIFGTGKQVIYVKD